MELGFGGEMKFKIATLIFYFDREGRKNSYSTKLIP